MYHYFVISQRCKFSLKTLLGLLSFLLLAAAAHNTSAITAQSVMKNALEVYEDIEDYAAVVHTYEADSMGVSESLFQAVEIPQERADSGIDELICKNILDW